MSAPDPSTPSGKMRLRIRALEEAMVRMRLLPDVRPDLFVACGVAELALQTARKRLLCDGEMSAEWPALSMEEEVSRLGHMPPEAKA